jgi:hypothetical protein
MRDWYSSANIDDRSLVGLTKEFGAQTKGAAVPRRRSLTSTGAVRTFLRLAYGTHLAQVAELVDALVSGTSGAIRGGSSPLLGTTAYIPFIFQELTIIAADHVDDFMVVCRCFFEHRDKQP